MMRNGPMAPLEAEVKRLGTAKSAPKRKYVERKCKACKTEFEVRIDVQNTLYGDFCAMCFFANVHLYADGSMELKTEEEKVKDLSYKDELVGTSHRGKMKVDN